MKPSGREERRKSGAQIPFPNNILWGTNDETAPEAEILSRLISRRGNRLTHTNNISHRKHSHQ
jgi:hypothetical protein